MPDILTSFRQAVAVSGPGPHAKFAESLDDPTATSLRELLMELWHSQPTTVLFVTHDRSEAIQLGTRILRLAPGEASVAQDAVVNLNEAERRDRAAVLAEQNRIFAAT